MNANWTWMMVVPALAVPLAWTCGVTSNAHAGTADGDALTRVQSKPSEAFDEHDWKTKLTQKDLAEREREFDRAVDEARRDDATRRALESWAKDDKNPDLAWTSRLALRELERRDVAGRRRSTPFGMFGQGGGTGGGSNGMGGPGAMGGGLPNSPQQDDLRSRFEDLQRQFGGLDSMFEDMQREMDRAFSGTMPPPSFNGGGGGNSAHRSSQGSSVQITPDGVKVTITEDVDGKQETKEYTAKTLDELYEAHPELRDKVGARVHVFSGPNGGGNFFGGVSPHRFQFDDDTQGKEDDSDSTLRPARPLQGGVRADILGILPASPSASERTAAKVDDGLGVKVERVTPGTIASQIAIQAGDILLELNGQILKDADDVRKIMRERHSDQDLVVTLADGKGQRRTLTWRAPAAASRRF